MIRATRGPGASRCSTPGCIRPGSNRYPPDQERDVSMRSRETAETRGAPPVSLWVSPFGFFSRGGYRLRLRTWRNLAPSIRWYCRSTSPLPGCPSAVTGPTPEEPGHGRERIARRGFGAEQPRARPTGCRRYGCGSPHWTISATGSSGRWPEIRAFRPSFDNHQSRKAIFASDKGCPRLSPGLGTHPIYSRR